MAVEINIDAAKAQQQIVALTGHIIKLEQQLKKLTPELTSASAANDKLERSSSSLSISYSKLATHTDASLVKFSELEASINKTYAATSKFASAVDADTVALKGLTSAIQVNEVATNGLNSAASKLIATKAQLQLLDDKGHQQLLREIASVESIIRGRKEHAKAQETYVASTMKSVSSAEKLIGIETSGSKLNMLLAKQMQDRYAAQEAYAASSMKSVSSAEKLIGIETSGSRMNTLIAQQMKERYSDLDKVTAGTHKFTEAQKILHQTARGLSGALGSLWLTYGQPMGPMLAGFAAAATAMGSIKISKDVEYTTKLIETLSRSFGEAGETATKLREDLHSLRDTRQGIDQLSLGLKEFVKAGISASDGMKHLEEMGRFATIAEIEMADAIKLVVANSNAFGESFTEVANKTTAAAFATTTEIKSMGNALSYATPLGSVLGLSLSEVETALGLLAQKGIDASKAGTSLTTTFMRLAAPTEGAKQAMQDLGVSFSAFDENGKIKPMRQQLVELSEIFSTLSEEKAVDLMGALSDLRSMKGLGNLIQDMGGDGKIWDDLFKKIDGAAKGITLLKQTSADLDETVTAKWEKFTATMTRLGDSEIVSKVSQVGVDTLAALAGAAEIALNPIDSASAAIKKLTNTAEEAEEKAGPALISLADQALIAAAKTVEAQAKPAPQLNIFQILGLPGPDEAQKQLANWNSFMESIVIGAGKGLSKGDIIMSGAKGSQVSLDSWHEKARIDERQAQLYKDIDNAAKERIRSEEKLKAEGIAASKKAEEARLKELEAFQEKEKLQKMELLGFFGLQDSKKVALDSWHKNAIAEEVEFTAESIEKQKTLLDEFYAELKQMSNEGGVGAVSELQQELDKIDKQIASMKANLSRDELFGDGIDKAKEDADKLGEELKKIAKAKLGNNVFDGFIAGLKESQQEAITLGKIGAELGRTFTSELATTFKDIFTGSNENKYADEMVTISEKIKQMQYESLEGGLAQLEWLRKEYDASLEGAMSGNEDMFQQYTSNLDEYLAKAKENMSPEEYAKVYAKTMEDLNKLNEEYADNTESTWDRIGDSFGDMADRILDKFLDMIAQMAAQDLMSTIIDIGDIGSSSSSSTYTGAITTVAGEAVSEAWDWASEIDWSTMFAADGGYIQAHEGGGRIVGGSGNKDDVFLGMLGNTAAYGMGGEYIVNKKATAKFLPLLEEINSKGFADGGYTGFTGGRDTGVAALVSSALAQAVGYALTKGFTAVTASFLGPLAAPVGMVLSNILGLDKALLGLTDSVFDVHTGFALTKESYAEALQSYADLQEDIATISLTNIDLQEDALASLLSTLTTAEDVTIGFLDSEESLGLALSETSLSIDMAMAELDNMSATFGITTEAVDTFADVFSDDAVQVNAAFQGVTLGSVELGSELSSLSEATASVSTGIMAQMEAWGEEAARVDAAWDAREAAMQAAHEEAQRELGRDLTDLLGLTDYSGDNSAVGTSPATGVTGGTMSGIGGDQGGDSRDHGGTSGTGNGTSGSVGSDGFGYNGEDGESSGWASGGWLGKYGSGWINQGNGYEDDVYLGTIGNTNSYGMGGEFVVNKRSAAKYAGLLEMVNKDYADGGTIGPSYLEASALAGSALSQYNSQITVITDDMEDNLKNIAKITEDVIYTFITETMDDLTKEIFDLNKSYDEQVKELKSLQAAESDYALVEQARNLELNKIQDEYNKEQLETAKEMADELADMMYDIRYDLRVGTLEDFQQSIQGIWETQKETVAKLKELGASFEEIREAVSLTWRKINEELLQQAKDELTEATEVLKDAFSAEKDSITTRYEEVMKGLNEQLSTANDKVSELEGIISSLDSALDTLKGSDVLQENTFRTAQADLRRRGLSGDISEGLDKTLSEAVKFSTDYYSTGEDYRIALKKSVGFTESLKKVASEQLTTAEAQVATIEAQIEMEENSYNAMIASLDAQLNSLLGIEATVMSIAEAISMYNKASAAVASANGQGGATGEVFNTSDYVQAKAESLVRGGWAKSVEEAANLFLQAIAKDNVTPYQHYQMWGEDEKVYNLSAREATIAPTTYGTGSFNTADYIQAKAASLFDSGYSVSIESAKEAFLSALAETGGTPEQHYAQFGTSEGIYKFATGGSFSVDGPSGIDNLAIPNVRLTAGEVVNVTSGDTMKELKEELAALRQVMAAIVSNTAVTAKQLSRWDGDGMPDVRVV